jgi:hypothetical protein
MTTQGRIEIPHSSEYGMKNSLFNMSLLLQEHTLWIGQLMVYQEASDTLEKFHGVDMDPSQIQRVCDTYGAAIGSLPEVERSDSTSAGEHVYVEVDGSMVFTDAGWREAKVGRIFRQSDCKKAKDGERTSIQRSEYVAQIEDCEHFESQMDEQLKRLGLPGITVLVFITDGATWIANWIREKYPEAIVILDFYHALERLSDIVKPVTPTEAKRKEWLADQKGRLLANDLDGVLEAIEKLPKGSPTDMARRAESVQYFKTNRYRMNYETYRAKGLMIGSGAIESAHRTLIQCRMKRSGQRWTIEGGNNLLNLRCHYKSGHWDQVQSKVISMKNGSIKNAA